MTDLSQFSIPELLTAVFNWAYSNDKRLYYNMDKSFDAHRLRGMIPYDKKPNLSETTKEEEFKPLEYLIAALKKADYHDMLRFRWVFIHGRDCRGEEYTGSELHPYSDIIPHIEEREGILKKNDLATWQKSEDHEKFSHFRFWINKLITDDKHYSLRLFEGNDGRCFNTLFLGTKDEANFKPILQYILDKNIIPEPHYQKLEVDDFVNPDSYNPRYLKTSVRHGGFPGLVHLTSVQLNEVYGKIDKRELDSMDRAVWSYINTVAKGDSDYPTKFFLFIK